ncbi:MAG TPA: GAF domain-containing protein, partial [Polyangia bacterium]|nr:GAF domain-containing protein [Polyangia bacterium]
METGNNGSGLRDRRLSVKPAPGGNSTHRRTEGDRASFTWRHQLLNDILKVAAPAGVALTALVIGFRSPIRLDPAAGMVATAAALVVALRFLPRLSFKLRAALTVLVIYGSALPTVVRSGFALSSGAVLMAAIVLAVILLGRGAAMSLLAATAAILVWFGFQAKAGHFVPHPLESDPHLARNWFRMAIGMDVVAAALASIVTYAVRHIEGSQAETSSALALLTGEQRRRSDLEQEWRRVDRDWARSATELGALAKNGDLAAGNTGAAFAALTEAGARGLGIERCGIWLFTPARRELRCRDLYAKTEGRHTHDLGLPAASAPAFFAALEGEQLIAAHRAQVDVRTRELEDLYLGGVGVGSLLAAPIRVQGRVVGMVCGEQVGTPMSWSDAQQSFAGALAGIAARALSAAERAERVLAMRASTEELVEMLDALKVRMAGIPTGIAGWEAAADDPRSLEAVDGILARVRQLSSELRAPAVDEVGLVTALRADLDAKAAASGVVFEIDAAKLTGPGSPETETACFWMVEELAANIVARTDTELVQIRLERAEGQLRATVEDDGWGTPTNPGVPIWGQGPIARVRQQVRALGGSVEVTLCEGAGSLVEICLP